MPKKLTLVEKKIIQEEVNKIMRKRASKGGKATFKKYGPNHMSEIVKKRWDKAKSGDKSA